MSFEGAHQGIDSLRLHERTARLEGEYHGTTNDIIRLQTAVDQLRSEIHTLTIEIRRSHIGATWAAIFAGAFAGSVSGFGSAIGFAMWMVAKEVIKL